MSDIQELIEELIKVRPEQLSKEGLKLFEKINEIIDKNKELESALANSVSKDEIKKVIHPTHENPIEIEIQTSSMYIKLQELLNKGE